MTGSTNVEHIIAKLDNDFNIDNSDWIPRVAAWVIQAMNMLDVAPKEKKRIQVPVKDRIARSNCIGDGDNIKVYDECCEELTKLVGGGCGCDTLPSTGRLTSGASDYNTVNDSDDLHQFGNEGSRRRFTHRTIDDVNNQKVNYAPRYAVKLTLRDGNPYTDDEVAHIGSYGNQGGGCDNNKRGYVVAGNNSLELNYDGSYVTIEYETTKTCQSNVYGCDLPVIPNNGLLIEAIGYYCMYKILCRGYKHPVFNLNASQYGTNPFYLWNSMKDEAKRSVVNGNIDDKGTKLFRSAFFIDMFDPRN